MNDFGDTRGTSSWSDQWRWYANWYDMQHCHIWYNLIFNLNEEMSRLSDLCRCWSPAVGVCKGAAAAWVQGAGRPRHRPHRHRSLRPRQNLPPPAAGGGAARDILAVCGGCDGSQHIPVLLNARNKREVLTGDQRKIYANWRSHE